MNSTAAAYLDVRRGAPHRGADLALLAYLCAFAFAMLFVFPLAAFALSTFLLINLPAGTPRYARLCLALVAAIGFAMMTGARPLDPGEYSDIDVYYELYQGLSLGDLQQLTAFGGGLEVALPLFMYALTLLLPGLTVNGLMICFCVLASLLMLDWVERSFYRGPSALTSPALMGICLLMLNLYFATQLTRQFLSLIVLLYAFTAQGRARRTVFVLLAASFHLTALGFYAIYLLVRRGPLGWAAIVLFALLLRVNFGALVAAFDIVPDAVAEKLAYYVDNSQEFTVSDLTSLRMIALLGAISALGWLASGFKPDRKSAPWMAVPWITAVVHFILLPIPLASLRATLMVHGVAPGLIAHRMLEGRARRVLALVLNVLFVYKILAFLMAGQGNTLSTPTILGGIFL